MADFSIKNTQVFSVMKFTSFPLFRSAGTLFQIFLLLFVTALISIPISLVGFFSITQGLKIIALLFIMCTVLGEFYFFIQTLSRAPSGKNIAKTLADNQDYNLGEFLSVNSCAIVANAVATSKKYKNTECSSVALFYAALTKNNHVKVWMFRLGFNIPKIIKELEENLKTQSQQKFSGLFSQSFENTILEAAKITLDLKHQEIGEKELLAGLARTDDVFKKALMDVDLKDTDVYEFLASRDRQEQLEERKKEFWTRENLARHGSLGKDFSAGFTVTLDKFGIDWRRKAEKGEIGEIFGREKELQELEIQLTKSAKGNILIIGEPGVGKKSLVKALAQRCWLGTGLTELHDKRIVEVDMVRLLTQIQDQEKLEQALDEVFSQAQMAGNVIVVVDKLDNFVTQKTQKAGEIDISVILGKYLAQPSFKFIGITTYDGLHRRLEQLPAFVENFSKIEVDGLSQAETLLVMQQKVNEYEQKNHIIILYPSIRQIISLTARYMPTLPFPKKAMDVLDEAIAYVKSKKEKALAPHHISEIISEEAKIPIGAMEVSEKSVLMNLEDLIHKRIVNQQEAVKEISIAMRRARAGLSSKKRPMGTFLFLGPTGVGKTETAKALAEIYFKGEDKMIRLDMSEFQAISDIPRLIGAISPVEQQGLLTTPVRENPFSLVLLDEIEKAHPNILNLFLQVLDEGHITDGQGRKVMFTNTIVIATSNAGAPMIFKAIENNEPLDKKKILDALFDQGVFKPEFINRFDAAVIFHPLTKENLMEIAGLILGGLQKSLQEKDIGFVVTPELVEKIVGMSYKPEFGAREMRRVVQDTIENEIAQALLSDKVTKGGTVEIDPETLKIIEHVK